ncbi:MAG: pyridoxal-phosphate dependent enzyme, partial [Bacteroidota bacterium]
CGGRDDASTGNHALGLARALRQADCSGTVYMPTNAVASKVEALKSYPVELVFAGNNSLETELEARSVAERTGAIWVSPYNDPKIIGGQGTIGIELLQQLADVDVVFATVGGGGLIAGIATYVKYLNPQTKIVGCLPERSPEMALSVKAGKIVTLEEAQETISDGSAGGVEPEAITFPVCQQLVDEFVLVSEQEIKSAIRLVVEQHHKIIEGAAGVAVAAFVKTAEKWPHKKAAIIICGSNIATSTLVDILSD